MRVAYGRWLLMEASCWDRGPGQILPWGTSYTYRENREVSVHVEPGLVWGLGWRRREDFGERANASVSLYVCVCVCSHQSRLLHVETRCKLADWQMTSSSPHNRAWTRGCFSWFPSIHSSLCSSSQQTICHSHSAIWIFILEGVPSLSLSHTDTHPQSLWTLTTAIKPFN